MKSRSLLLVVFLMLNTLLVFGGSGKKDHKARKANHLNARVETKTLEGNVADVITGEPLTGVMVKVTGSDRVVYTDFDGNFSLPVNNELKEGSIELSYVSYPTTKVEFKKPGRKKIKIGLNIF